LPAGLVWLFQGQIHYLRSDTLWDLVPELLPFGMLGS